MRCTACGNTEFEEHFSGFLVCSLCFTQANSCAALVDESLPALTPTPLKRKMKSATAREDKTWTYSEGLDWQEYCQIAQEVLKAMVKPLGLKSQVLTTAQALLAKALPQDSHTVYPKNRRLRQGASYLQAQTFPKEVRNFLSAFTGFAPRKSSKRFSIGLKRKQLVELCQERNLDPLKFSLSMDFNDKAGLLIYIYETLSNKHPIRLHRTSRTNFENSLFEVFNELYKPSLNNQPKKTPFEMSYFLVVIYTSILYTYSESWGVLVSEVLQWAYEGKLPYFTAYKALSVEDKYESLFKPLSLPSEQWIRRVLPKFCSQLGINVFQPFLEYEVFCFNLASKIINLLDLPGRLVDATFNVYKRCKPKLTQKEFKHTLPEVIVSACVFIVIKLFYGLNDLPYLIDQLKEKPQFLSQSQVDSVLKNLDDTANEVHQLPPLSYILNKLQDKSASRVLQTHQVYALQSYYSHLEQALCYSKLSLADHKLPKTKDLPFVKVTQEPKSVSSYLEEELSHHQDPEAEFPLPASDFYVQMKKSSQKNYPAHYLFVLHSIAFRVSNIETKHLHHVVDSLERFISSLE